MIRPILFNTEMVMAILDGRKTVTRRPVKPRPPAHCFLGSEDEGHTFDFLCGECRDGVFVDWVVSVVAPFVPGDVLWVRESWAEMPYGVVYRADRFRAAYGRHVKELPRCCVFFGTTNTAMFLRDRTGNRRFWPVDVGIQQRKKLVWDTLDEEVDQIWAEAVMRWRFGEGLFLTGELEEEAKEEQEAHREVSSKEGIILDFIDQPVPEDWPKWSLDKRRMYLNGTVEGNITLVKRDRVCALEIWCEAFGGQPRDFRYSDSTEINDILRAIPGWEKTPGSLRFGYCGKQRGFQRIRGR